MTPGAGVVPVCLLDLLDLLGLLGLLGRWGVAAGVVAGPVRCAAGSGRASR